MSKPYKHAVSSAEKFGGQPNDYLEIHNFMDWSKIALPDPRHRAVFHSAFGIYVVEYVFGEVIYNSDDQPVSVRDVAEQHIIEDLGFVPTLEQWFKDMPIVQWMSPRLKPADDAEPMVTDYQPDPIEDQLDLPLPAPKILPHPHKDRWKELEEFIKKATEDQPKPLPYIEPRDIRPRVWPSPTNVPPWDGKTLILD